MSEIYNFEQYIDLSQTPNTICDPIRVPIGVNSTGSLEFVDLGDDYRHNILVSGRCGSGRSMYLHTLINSVMLSYSTDCLNIWLYDAKMCEYRRYSTESHPHIKHTYGGDECEALLTALEEELKRRERVYINAQSQSYSHYIKGHKCVPFPRLLVVMDDFDYFLMKLFDQNYQNHYRICNLLRMASTFGITFAVTVQSPERLPALLFSMFEIRMALPHYPDAVKALFDKQDVPAAYQDLRRGEALVNTLVYTSNIHKVKLLYLSSDAINMIASVITNQ